MLGKQAVVDALRRQGVAYVFGNSGTSELPILELLAATDCIRYVLALQEGVAMGMADGYARAARRPACVVLHREAGLANALSLLINSAYGGTPLVLCAVNADQRKLFDGRVDLALMASQFTKASFEVPRADMIAQAFAHAFDLAARPPAGPVFVSLPFDVLDVEAGTGEVFEGPPGAPAWPDPKAIAAAAAVLAGSGATALLVGDRVAEAGAVVPAVALAEVLGCDVYATHLSEVSFPTGHPLFRGAFPVVRGASRDALGGVEVILAVGTSVFGGFFYLPGVLPPDCRLIHIDSSAAEIARNERTEIGIPGDIAAGLGALRDAVRAALPADRPHGPTTKGAPPIAPRERRVAAADDAGSGPGSGGEARSPMATDDLMRELSLVLPPGAVVVEDSGTAKAALHRAVQFNQPGVLHGSRGGAMGWGMGAALGVQLADRARSVICVVGDGTAAMTVQALWTAAREDLAVIYVVCNNASYRAVELNARTYRELAGEPPIAGGAGRAALAALVDLQPPLDLAALACAFGVRGRRIESVHEVGPALAEALAQRSPTLLDVVIDGRDLEPQGA